MLAKYKENMIWDDTGFLLSKNRYNENSLISEMYTKNHGKISGIIFGGAPYTTNTAEYDGEWAAGGSLSQGRSDLMGAGSGETSAVAIGGFSQGCMLTLQTGIKRKDSIRCILGFSGKIINASHLNKNLNSKPDILLMHGDLDEVVPVNALLEAKEFFNKNNYKIETKIFKNCEHRIPSEGSSLGLKFIKNFFY